MTFNLYFEKKNPIHQPHTLQAKLNPQIVRQLGLLKQSVTTEGMWILNGDA